MADQNSKYISCQKAKFSTTQLVIGGIGVVLGLFLVGFGIVWLLNRRKSQNRKQAEDGGETGEGKMKDEKDYDSDDEYTDDESYDGKENTSKGKAIRKTESDDETDESSEEDDEDRRTAAWTNRQARQAPLKQSTETPTGRILPQAIDHHHQAGPSIRPALKQQSSSTQPLSQSRTAPHVTSATVDSESEEEGSTEEETETETETDSDDSDQAPAKKAPVPRPEIKKPQSAIQRIPRTESPELLSEEGSPLDRQPSRQLYPSNPSPNPRYLNRMSYAPVESAAIPIPQNGRPSLPRQNSTSSRQSPGSESSMPALPSTARSRESTLPLNVRKGSNTAVRQPSFYEPSSRGPVRASPPTENQATARRPSVPKTNSENGATRSASRSAEDRRPSQGQVARLKGPSETTEGSRKGSTSSRSRRPSERV